MDKNADGRLSSDEFVEHFMPFAMDYVDIRLTLLAVLLKSMAEAEEVDESFKKMAENRLEAVQAQMHLQYHLRTGTMASPSSQKRMNVSSASQSDFRVTRSCPGHLTLNSAQVSWKLRPSPPVLRPSQKA